MAEMYNFQIEAVARLLTGKRIIVSDTGSGKTAMALKWAEYKCRETDKNKVLIVTTASKCHAKTSEGLNDFEADAKLFCSDSFLSLLNSSLTVISWHKLREWEQINWREVPEYVIIFDEIQKAGAGVDSGMGKAFLKITKRNKDWAGFTGTPGDTWLKFYPYFQSCGLVRGKTCFLNEYANVQTYKGYPEIIGWRNEGRLKQMWAMISYAPDTQKVMNELPPEMHEEIVFSKPTIYNKVISTRKDAYGNFLDMPNILCNELRRMCFTNDKQKWIKEFIEGLDCGCVLFYNFVATGEKLEEIIHKIIPKEAKIWRIDGRHHEIPTSDTIGKNDIVLCQWQSGSEALNLQFLHYWVSVEPHYSYSISKQAKGRIRRIGQEMPQFYYYLRTENTIEEDVYKCLAEKKEFSEENWCIDKNLI